MVIRQDYIEKIKPYVDVKLVKILAGIRRSGKSTIFDMIKGELESRGISSSHIICLKYSSNEFERTFTAKEMFERAQQNKKEYQLTQIERC